MSENNLYYIYIDTKIPGALEQLVSYFQTQIFDRESCISVVCKFYKEIESLFTAEFSKHNIPFCFIKKRSDLSLIKGKTIFYLFNAQSNCRMVAIRDLTHIFVTHGESHKLASIKPIIRIYDYVITSGKVGIDRYLKAGIFSQYDIKNEKVIPLGDTFIGGNRFKYSAESTSLLYAPTWEGGIPEENYSSIGYATASKIINFCFDKNIKTIYIQSHPNLGHRDKTYKVELNKMISRFKRNALRVVLVKRNPLKKTNAFFNLLIQNQSTDKISVKYALTDISAMEMQFYNQKIPYAVLIKSDSVKFLSIPSKMNSYYSGIFVPEDKEIEIDDISMFESQVMNSYLFSYHKDELLIKSYKERIAWLCHYTNQHRVEYMESLQEVY